MVVGFLRDEEFGTDPVRAGYQYRIAHVWRCFAQMEKTGKPADARKHAVLIGRLGIALESLNGRIGRLNVHARR